MDEPTNHLDIESIIWLEEFLKTLPGALLMTSHDREFMNRIVTRIAEIDGGEITAYSGNYDFYERERAIRETNREAAYARQQAMLAKEQRFIDRFAAHAAKAAQVQSRVKALEKIEKVELPKKRRVVKFDFRPPPRSGEQVATLEGGHQALRHAHRPRRREPDDPPRRALVRHGQERRGQVDAAEDDRRRHRARRGDRHARRQPEDGLLRPAVARRPRSDLTIEEQLQKDFPAEPIGALKSLAGAFQFSGEDTDKRIRMLSGGEKTRLVMARMLLNPPNFLVLDEPTNHLDLATKEMLIEALHDFEGTMVFVSHDREFLRGLSNRVLELGGESGTDAQPHAYPGTYVEYVERTGHEAPGVHK